MHGASDARTWVIGILLAWTVVFAASYIAPTFIAPTGDGFMRGFNRVPYWFWGQVAALVLAIAVCVSAHVRRADISRMLVRFSRVPLLVAAAEILALIAVILWAGYHP